MSSRPIPTTVRTAEYRPMNQRFPILIMACCLSLPVVGHETQEAMVPEFPQQQSAADLLYACASSGLTRLGRDRQRYCAGFVSGVEEAVRLLHASGRSEHPLCTPPDISATTLAKAFVRYGANHKGELQVPAATGVLHALEEAFPCPDQP